MPENDACYGPGYKQFCLEICSLNCIINDAEITVLKTQK